MSSCLKVFCLLLSLYYSTYTRYFLQSFVIYSVPIEIVAAPCVLAAPESIGAGNIIKMAHLANLVTPCCLLIAFCKDVLSSNPNYRLVIDSMWFQQLACHHIAMHQFRVTGSQRRRYQW